MKIGFLENNLIKYFNVNAVSVNGIYVLITFEKLQDALEVHSFLNRVEQYQEFDSDLLQIKTVTKTPFSINKN